MRGLVSADIMEWAGRDGIIKPKPEVVSKWAITDAEKDILLRVGLPRELTPFFEASVQRQVEPVVSSKSHGELYKVGWDLGNDIAVGSDSTGVWAIDPDGEPDLFINSTLTHLVIFLHAAGKARCDNSWENWADDGPAIANLRERLTEVDAPALPPDLNTWWSLVFEQMEEGLV
jgi:hypothetical protein